MESGVKYAWWKKKRRKTSEGRFVVLHLWNVNQRTVSMGTGSNCAKPSHNGQFPEYDAGSIKATVGDTQWRTMAVVYGVVVTRRRFYGPKKKNYGPHCIMHHRNTWNKKQDEGRGYSTQWVGLHLDAFANLQGVCWVYEIILHGYGLIRLIAHYGDLEFPGKEMVLYFVYYYANYVN